MGGVKKLVRGVTDTVGLTTAKVPGVGQIALKQDAFNIGKEVDPIARAIAAQQQMAAGEQAITSPAKAAALNQMALAAQGKAPTLAETQLRAAQDRSLAQQMAALQGTRGGNVNAARRNLAKGIQSQNRDIGQQAAQAAFQERKAFIDQAGQQDERALDLLRQKLEIDTAEKRTLQDYEKARSGAQATSSQLLSQAKQAQQGALGGLLQGGMMAYALSDKTQKQNIKPANKQVDSFLKELSARQYDYKKPDELGASPGTKVGIMAQDLEKSSLGKQMVKEVNGNKMVDMAGGFSAVLAAQARLNERLEKLETKKKGKA